MGSKLTPSLISGSHRIRYLMGGRVKEWTKNVTVMTIIDVCCRKNLDQKRKEHW